MRKHLQIVTLLLAFIALGCGEKVETRGDGFSINRRSAKPAAEAPVRLSGTPASRRVDLANKGVGPVKTIELSETPDPDLSRKGERLYNRMCLACHRIGKKSIGPALNDILDRRSPEWVMNMTLDPERMVREDSLARDLFREYNGSPMANQGLNREQARGILEYLRTLE